MNDNAWLWLVRHLPRKLRYWSFIVVAAEATQTNELRGKHVPAITIGQMLPLLKV